MGRHGHLPFFPRRRSDEIAGRRRAGRDRSSARSSGTPYNASMSSISWRLLHVESFV